MSKTVYNIVQTDWGIGDIICSLYGIQALALEQPECQIYFYIRGHFQWVALADIPQLKTMRYRDRLLIPQAISLHEPRDDKHMNSPKRLYASKLNVTPVVPKIRPEILKMRPLFDGKYIVLSPFASHNNRTGILRTGKFWRKNLMLKAIRLLRWIALGKNTGAVNWV